MTQTCNYRPKDEKSLFFFANQHCRQLQGGLEIHLISYIKNMTLTSFIEQVLKKKQTKPAGPSLRMAERLQGGTILPVPFLCSQSLQVLQGDELWMQLKGCCGWYELWIQK